MLQKLWGEAYHLGAQSGKAVSEDVEHQGEEVLIAQSGRTWLNEIVQTRLDKIAQILGSGLSRAETEKQIRELLGNGSSADMIAQTEITRAVSAGAHAVYRAAGIYQVRWLTDPDPPVPCPLCLKNETYGPVFYGNPFPGGVIEPPQHPMCRCALLPA